MFKKKHIPSNFNDLTGNRFGRLVVVSRGESSASGFTRWICKCDCGGESLVLTASLNSGNTKSCGCLHKEITSKRRMTHGMTGEPEHQAWNHAKERCYNPKTWNYANYGGRGIKMCDRWKNSFENFLEDMGMRPSSKHSLDRYPNRDGDYEPGNCRWATIIEQARNKDRVELYEHDGRSMTLKEWALESGIPYKNLWKRIKARGWSLKCAMMKMDGRLTKGDRK